jgi:hypothetical protein
MVLAVWLWENPQKRIDGWNVNPDWNCHSFDNFSCSAREQSTIGTSASTRYITWSNCLGISSIRYSRGTASNPQLKLIIVALIIIMKSWSYLLYIVTWFKNCYRHTEITVLSLIYVYINCFHISHLEKNSMNTRHLFSGAATVSDIVSTYFRSEGSILPPEWTESLQDTYMELWKSFTKLTWPIDWMC